MFVYDIVNDPDIVEYEYELYNQDQIELNNITSEFEVKEDATPSSPISSGKNRANVFTVAVENSTVVGSTLVPKTYYGRVRAIDSSGNLGEWSNIAQADQDTPLIDEQFIGSLTASKITAGTISSAEIVMSGAGSILKSSLFDPNAASPIGWYISGDGSFSLGGNSGITYTPGIGVEIGSDVEIDANLTINANEVTINGATSGSILSIKEDLIPGATPRIAGLGIGAYSATPSLPFNNYWFTDGNFRVGKDENNFLSFNSSGLTIRAGSNPNIGLRVDNTGRVWAGDANFGTSAEFRMDAFGKVTIGTGDEAGTAIPSQQWLGAESLRINGILLLAGSAKITGSLTVENNTANSLQILKRVNSTTTESVLAVSTSTKQIDVNGSLTTNGAVGVNGTLTVNGSTSINGNITLTSPTAIVESGSGTIRGNNGLIYWRLNSTGLDASLFSYDGSATNESNLIFKIDGNNGGQIRGKQMELTHSANQAVVRLRRNFNNPSGGAKRFMVFTHVDASFNETTSGNISHNSTSSVGYNSGSDARLKTEIKKEINALEKILQINPKLFYWNSDENKKETYGFFAQDLYSAFEQAVTVGGDDPIKEPWMVDYSSLTPLLVKAIQELSAKIDKLL